MQSDDYDLRDDEELEDIEGYCVRCRETVVIQDPLPVWTRRGLPAMRGDCPNCGETVFRLGSTAAHNGMSRPAAIQVGSNRRTKLPQDTVYLNFAEQDEAFALQMAADLEKVGIATWLHKTQEEQVNWAGGIHPALVECARMVYVLSPWALLEQTVESAWKTFRDKHKPVVIAQLGPVDPPDALRRSPRFDFSKDYKGSFRQMIQALSG